MLPAEHLSHIGHELKPDTRSFLGETVLQFLNVLDTNGIETEENNFLGTKDIFVLRGTNICIFVFSRSRHGPKPAFSEYNLSEVIPDEVKLVAQERTYFNFELLQSSQIFKAFKTPVAIAFPVNYLALQGADRERAIEKVAELLQQPTFEDIDKRRRIVRVNPIFHGRDFLIDERLCFVLMPFKKPFTEIYESLIKPTVEAEGFTCFKSDDLNTVSAVIEDIWENINKASLIIAEITGNNPNVMYELGICHTVGKNVMMITQTPEDIPFNFRHMRYYAYKNDIAGFNELKKNIEGVLRQIKSIQKK